jgi:hypothetical protein
LAGGSSKIVSSQPGLKVGGGDLVNHAVFPSWEIAEQAGREIGFSAQRFRRLINEGAQILLNKPFEREVSLRGVDPSNIPLEVLQFALGFDKIRCPLRSPKLLALGFYQCEVDSTFMHIGKDKAPTFSETLEHLSWVSALAFSQTRNKGYDRFFRLAESNLSLFFTNISGV